MAETLLGLEDYYNKNKGDNKLIQWVNSMFQAKYVVQKGYDDGLDLTERELYKPQNGQFFVPGKMYVFKYEPKGKEKYDGRPILFCTQVGENKYGYYVQGIDVNTIPVETRAQILDGVVELFRKEMEQQVQKAEEGDTYIPKDMVKTLGDDKFLTQAFKTPNVNAFKKYYIAAIQEPSLFELDDWQYIPFIQPQEFVGISFKDILKSFFSLIKPDSAKKKVKKKKK